MVNEPCNSSWNLNSQDIDIKFSMKIEKDNVYHKPTHTYRYLHAHSLHHSSQKNSVMIALIHRAFPISQLDNLQAELNHVQNSLLNNGYRKEDI